MTASKDSKWTEEHVGTSEKAINDVDKESQESPSAAPQDENDRWRKWLQRTTAWLEDTSFKLKLSAYHLGEAFTPMKSQRLSLKKAADEILEMRFGFSIRNWGYGLVLYFKTGILHFIKIVAVHLVMTTPFLNDAIRDQIRHEENVAHAFYENKAAHSVTTKHTLKSSMSTELREESSTAFSADL